MNAVSTLPYIYIFNLKASIEGMIYYLCTMCEGERNRGSLLLSVPARLPQGYPEQCIYCIQIIAELRPR